MQVSWRGKRIESEVKLGCKLVFDYLRGRGRGVAIYQRVR